MIDRELAGRFVESLRAALDVAEEFDGAAAKSSHLSRQEARILHVLSRREQCSMRAVASAVYRSQSSVTSLIDRLVKKGLVDREYSRSDRRIVEVRLTEHGRAAHEGFIACEIQLAQHLLIGLTKLERNALAGTIELLMERSKAGKPRITQVGALPKEAARVPRPAVANAQKGG